MKDAMKIIGAIVGALVVMFLLGWAIQGNSFFMYKYWAPKQERVQRKVFEETPGYVKGGSSDVENLSS
jgi:hypothetical protein